MPSVSSSLFFEWIQPGAVVAVVGLLLGVFRGLRAELQEEIRSSEARQEKQMNELKEASRSLGEKFDRALEVLLAAKT